ANLFVFFFSSRRRHTRFSRDWSSDVCSSDLDHQHVKVGALVHLDASASVDADGDEITYAWTILQTPAGSAAALSDTRSVKPSFKIGRASCREGAKISGGAVSSGTNKKTHAT